MAFSPKIEKLSTYLEPLEERIEKIEQQLVEQRALMDAIEKNLERLGVYLWLT